MAAMSEGAGSEVDAHNDDANNDDGHSRARTFTCDGRDWVVLDGGRSLTGTGHLAPAPLRLIQFAHADAPDLPLLEITAGPGNPDDLHDAELVALLQSARQVPVYSAPGESGVEDRRLRTGGAHGREHSDSRRRR